jgi:hypothetical protein
MGKNDFRDFFRSTCTFSNSSPLQALMAFSSFHTVSLPMLTHFFFAHTKGTDDAVDAMYLFPTCFSTLLLFNNPLHRQTSFSRELNYDILSLRPYL